MLRDFIHFPGFPHIIISEGKKRTADFVFCGVFVCRTEVSGFAYRKEVDNMKELKNLQQRVYYEHSDETD